ncbi:hypothetical protein DDQ41_05370 [Streptomyces spongiicola]|uniref:Secreted protein n=1 Tax=Streptomyces spongiicola TaxID=1690221 RepID=A0ABM6V3H5_9ACTN|nr:hypothetical protein DDQ41_05370 [Streptomyces spongiicola]
MALTFGTLLSSQGTDASIVLTRRTLSGAFLRALPFGVSNPTRSDFRTVPGAKSISDGRWRAFRLSTASRLPFGVFTTLADSPGDS